VWTLLYAVGAAESVGAARAETRGDAVASAAPRTAPRATAGRAILETTRLDVPPQHSRARTYEPRNGSNLRVRIVIWPGGGVLDTIDLSRAVEQFDLSTAERFDSLAEAKAACAQRIGFLVEIFAPDSERRGGDVLFVRNLRI